MRNGIYRVWYSGTVEDRTVTMLIDGELIACDHTHAYHGRYTDRAGQFRAEVTAKRHTLLPEADDARQLDECHLVLAGHCTDEVAMLTGTSTERPDFLINLKYVWLCEI